MPQSTLKNVVFDIGNVLVRWSPREIVRLTFGDEVDDLALATQLFRSELWMALNRGELTEDEIKQQFQTQFDLSQAQVDTLFYYIKHTQIPIYGSTELVKRVRDAGYSTYALTDNVHEIVAHLKQQYDFWNLFKGAIVSAEEGCLKPSAEIFNRLLDKYSLKAEECVFIDDVLANIEGAARLGFKTVLFKNAAQCEAELKYLGLHLI